MTALINAGQRVTADVLNELIPLNAIKAGDQHYVNTTLVADPELFVQVNANTSYLFTSTLFVEGGANGSSDFKFEWTVPSGSALSLCIPAYYYTDGGTHGPVQIGEATVWTTGTEGAGKARPIFMTGSLTTGGSPGVVQLMAAKNSSGSTDAIIHAQSVVALQEVG
jgi:hypothetical protein